MKAQLRYIRQEIQLENYYADGTFPEIDEAGYYCVFWWHSIPLGDLFVEKGRAPSKESWQYRVFSVIEPTVDFYSNGREMLTASCKRAFFENDLLLFNKEMYLIFGNSMPGSVPKKVEISVVICTRNRSQRLQQCLSRLKEQYSIPEEIIVVDNAPSDESTRLVVEQHPEITYLREPRHGLDIARNAGARLAKHSIVAYVDDDVMVHSLWAYRVWEAFLSNQVDALTGLVIALTLDTEAQQIFEKFWSFNRGYRDKIYDYAYFKKNLAEGPPVWEIGAGANMAFRKSVFDRVGYFDNRLDVGAAGCSGDSEMWFRILANGGTIAYSSKPVVYHEHRKDLKDLHTQLFFYMRGFAAAALIQQERYAGANYKKRIFRQLPQHYLMMLFRSFPRYSFQNQTLLSEIRGLISGILFYYNRKNKSPQ